VIQPKLLPERKAHIHIFLYKLETNCAGLAWGELLAVVHPNMVEIITLELLRLNLVTDLTCF